MAMIRLLMCFGFIIGNSLAILPAHAFSNLASPQTHQTSGQLDSELEPYKPSATRLFDLIHTRLDLTPIWASRQLQGLANLRLKPHFYNQNILILDAKAFDISSVSLTKPTKKKLAYTYDGKKIRIELGKYYDRNQVLELELEYTANPEKVQVSNGSAISQDKGLYFINHDLADTQKPRQLWTQGETQSASCWFPTIDHPNQRCTQEIHLTVDNSYTTLSNGVLSSSMREAGGLRTDVWEMKKPHAPYLFMIAAGNWKVVKDKWRNIELSYLLEPAFEKYAKQIFGKTPKMMEFFSKTTGVDYPWDKYGQVVVRDFVSGAMENTTASVFNEQLNSTDRQLEDQNWDGIIAHELFHHWFGDYVTCESWANLALNESFANYGEYLWYEHDQGRDFADAKNLEEMNEYFAEAQTKKEPIIRYHHGKDDDMFDRHTYQKGGRILHTLRYVVGQEAFFESIKRYLNTYKYQSVEIHNLRLIFEQVSGNDLNWFFDQWFLKPGHPVLEISNQFKDNKLKVYINQTQDSSSSQASYRLPMQLDYWVNGQKISQKIVLNQRNEVFEFECAIAPDVVIVDAESMLLADVSHPKTTAQYMAQYTYMPLYAHRLAALEALGKQSEDSLVQTFMLKVLQDPAHQLRQMAIQNLYNARPSIQNQAFEVIQKLAKSDKQATVRGEALRWIARVSAEKGIETYQAAFKDKSYTVAAIGLMSMIKYAPDQITNKLASFDTINHGAIAAALGYYYADRSTDTTKYNWYINKIQRLMPQESYEFFDSFSHYLLRVEGIQKQNGIAFFTTTASASESAEQRYFAYTVLKLLLAQDPNPNAILKPIRDKETHPQLKEIYNTQED